MHRATHKFPPYSKRMREGKFRLLADNTRGVEGYVSRGSYWMRRRGWLFQCCVHIPKFWLNICVGVASHI